MPRWLSGQRPLSIAVIGVTVGVLLTLNLIPRGPRIQSSDENTYAHGRTCTEISQGWPFDARCFYPQGFIHPLELLPHEVLPRCEVWHVFGAIADALMALVILIAEIMLIRGFFSSRSRQTQ